MRRLFGIGLLVALYGVLPGVQATLFLSSQPFADTLDTLNFVASIVAYHWLLANVLMGLKLPVLQRTLPYDLRIRWHIVSTQGLVIFLSWHAIYTIFIKNKIIDPVSWGLMAVFWALLALSLLWIPLPGFQRARVAVVDVVRRQWVRSYDLLKAWHKALYFILAAFTYVHIVQAEVMVAVPVWAGWAYTLLFVVAAAAFLATRVHNLTLPTLTVRDVSLQAGIVRLNLEPHRRLRYHAGQFAFLRFERKDLRAEEHPFSFTTIQSEPRVGFAMRALGDFTTRLAGLQPGDRVRVNGGFGAFFPRTGVQPLALIGSGIGAVPLIGILKQLAENDPLREVVCLLAVTRREELVEEDALNGFHSRLPHLKLRVFVQSAGDPRYSQELLARELGDPGRFRYFLCSSELVRREVSSALGRLKVPARHLHFEAFSLG